MTFYNDYFQDLASRHPQLLHTETDCHFWHLADTDTLKDLNDALRGTLVLPALVLHPFEDSPSTENDFFSNQLAGAFSILMLAKPGDWAGQRQARYQAKAMGLEIIARMRTDMQHGGPLYAQKIKVMGQFPGHPELLIAGQATGWTYEFTWLMPQPLPAPTW